MPLKQFYIYFSIAYIHKYFWIDVGRLIKKTFDTDLQLREFDIMIHFNDHAIEKDNTSYNC